MEHFTLCLGKRVCPSQSEFKTQNGTSITKAISKQEGLRQLTFSPQPLKPEACKIVCEAVISTPACQTGSGRGREVRKEKNENRKKKKKIHVSDNIKCTHGNHREEEKGRQKLGWFRPLPWVHWQKTKGHVTQRKVANTGANPSITKSLRREVAVKGVCTVPDAFRNKKLKNHLVFSHKLLPWNLHKGMNSLIPQKGAQKQRGNVQIKCAPVRVIKTYWVSQQTQVLHVSLSSFQRRRRRRRLYMTTYVSRCVKGHACSGRGKMPWECGHL